jgi:hypothetical protein
MIKRLILAISTVLFCSSSSIGITATKAKELCKNWNGIVSTQTSISVTIKKNQIIKVSKSKNVGQWAIYNSNQNELDVWQSRQFEKNVDFVEFYRENNSQNELPNLQAGTYNIKYLSGFGKRDSLKICIR